MGTMTYVYDAESRVAAVYQGGSLTAKYVYDASGARVAKLNASGAATAVYVLGPGGVYAELDSGDNIVHRDLYAGGKMVASYDRSGALHLHLSDWLGTRRAQTDAAGVLQMTYESFPFGDGYRGNQISGYSGDDSNEKHFTGKERDTETDLDYFGARYLASSMGRFMSPDWSAGPSTVPYASLGNPQSLNLYAYVENNPMSGVDADGHTGSCGGDKEAACKVTLTRITQTITFHDMVKGKEVASTVKVVTDLTTVSNSKTGAIVSAYASGTATNVTSHYSSSQLATIGSTVAGIQQAGASMALGASPQQLMTAIVAKESTLGIQAPTNPLQLSGSSGIKPRPGDTSFNIQGGLTVLQERGRRSNYDPAATYDRYNGVSDPVQRSTNVNVFMSIYKGMTQSSSGWSPSMPSAPLAAGL